VTTLLPCPTETCDVVLFRGDVCPVCLTPGATDAPLEWSVLASHPGRDDLRLPCPTAANAQTTARSINQDSTQARAEIQTRPAVGWSSS
jgi:hypothetical protein